MGLAHPEQDKGVLAVRGVAEVLGWTLDGSARHIVRVSFLLALLLGWLTGAPSWATSVQEVRVHADRIELRFDGRLAEAGAFALAGPKRRP